MHARYRGVVERDETIAVRRQASRWRPVPAGSAGAWFGFTLGVAYLVAAVLTYRRHGLDRSTAFDLLFAPNSRLTDTYTLLGLLRTGDMYGAGFQYPPGSLVAITITDRFFSADVGAPQVAAAVAGMAILIGVLAFRDARFAERVAAGALAGMTTYATVSTHAHLVVPLAVVGAATVAAIGVLWIVRRDVPRLVIVPAIAVCYPLVFSVDRGNLETYVFALLAISASLVFGIRRSRGAAGVAGVMFGLAVAIKVLPVTLIAVQSSRRHRWAFVLAGAGGVAFASVYGLITVGQGPLDVLSAMRGNNFAGGERPPGSLTWGLFYHRGIASAAMYALAQSRGYDAMEQVMLGLIPFFLLGGIIILLAVVVASALLPGPVWMRYTAVAAASMLFANASVLYRAPIIVIALSLWLASAAIRPRGLEAATAVLFALVLTPYAFGSIPTPLVDAAPAAPSDTLYGTLALLGLFLVVTWRWLCAYRGNRSVLRHLHGVKGVRGRASAGSRR